MVNAAGFKIPQSVLVVIYTPALDVLMIRRADVQDTVFWQSVTGSKDAESDSFEATAVREVAEETGIRCGADAPAGHLLQDWGLENRYSIYPRWLHRYPPGTAENVEHVFGLQVPANTAVRLNPREHSEFCWLPWRAAADLCFSPSNAEAILMLPRWVSQPTALHSDR